jgi:hypothetical protein
LISILILAGACRSDGQPTTKPNLEPSAARVKQSTDVAGAMPMRHIVIPAPADLERHKRERTADPAFALEMLGPHRYRGRIADECPVGTTVVKPEKGWKLDNGSLEMKMPAGGCPTWIGYTVVAVDREALSEPARDRLPPTALPFYVCEDRWHDTCESLGENTWVFELSTRMTKSKAREVVFASPTPVDPMPGSLCCCTTDNKNEVTTYPTCEVRGGACDVEAECYGIEGPIP